MRSGVGKDRVLRKLAITWEGIKAGEILAKEGIHVPDIVIWFGKHVHVRKRAYPDFTIVGRILDWYKAKMEKQYTQEMTQCSFCTRALRSYKNTLQNLCGRFIVTGELSRLQVATFNCFTNVLQELAATEELLTEC